MPDISPQEIKWTIASLGVILLISGIGFGVGGVSGTQDVPQLNTSDINSDFVPDQTPTRPQRGNIEGVLPVPALNEDANSRSIYSSSGASPNYEILLSASIVEDGALEIRALYGTQEQDTGTFGSEEVRIIDQQLVTFNTSEVGVQKNATIDSADGTWAFGTTLTQSESSGSGYAVTYESTSTPITSGPISAVVDAIVWLVTWLQYLFMWIIGTFVSIVTGLITFMAFFLAVAVFVLTNLANIMSLHPVISFIVVLPLTIVTFTVIKFVIIVGTAIIPG